MSDIHSEGEERLDRLLAVDLLPGDCLEEEIFSAVISRYKIFIFILLEICKFIQFLL